MTCILCPRTAFYQVPKTEKFFCDDHADEARTECKKQTHERDRPHYPERFGIFAQAQPRL